MSNIHYEPPATIANFMASEKFYNFIIGPVGCLAGRSLVVTEYGAVPIADIDRPMRVLSWNEKTGQYQLSWCGGSFPKGRDYLYRVSTPQGEFDAAGSHLLLCDDGKYRRVQELRPGHALAAYSDTPLQTSEELSRSESPEDARRSTQTDVSYLGGCAALNRQRGRQFLSEEDTDRATAPSRSGVLGSILPRVRAGVSQWGAILAGLSSRTPSSLSYAHSQTGGCRPLDGPLRQAGAGHVSGESFGRAVGLSPRGTQSPLRCGFRPLLRGLGRSVRGLVRAFKAPSSLTTTDRPILSITRLGVKEAYWDMQVDGTENYVTVDGAIHHNSSKTTGILFKILYHAARQKPGPDGIRRTRWVVVRNTLPQLKDTTLNSFFTWFKPGEAGEWRVTDNKFIFKFDDIYAEVLFRPLDTADDVHRVLSLEVTGAILDEFVEIPKAIVEALSARCGRYPSAKDGGPTWWGMWGASNPGNEDDWWYNWLYEEKPDNLGYFEQPSGFLPTAENVENLPGGVGYYQNLMVGKSAAWVKQFIEVKWGFSLRGKPVYRTFNPDIHIARSPLIYNPHLPLVMGFDAGLTPAAIFGQQDSNGRVLVLRELVSENMGAKRFCREKIKPLLNNAFPHCNLIVVADPATSQRAQTDERSVRQVLEEELGVRVKPAYSNTLTDRLGAVEDYLTRLTEVGPAYLLDPSCKVLARGFTSGYRYPVSNKGQVGDSPEKNSYSHCFVEGTPVRTPKGDIAIELLRPGDTVSTPEGSRKVLAAMSSLSCGIVDLVFSNGATLSCTPDHPFVTERGVVPADELQYTDVLFYVREPQCTPSSEKSGSTVSPVGTGWLRRVNQWAKSGIFTGRCGRKRTAQSPTGGLSTILTTTEATTGSETYSALPEGSTADTTLKLDYSPVTPARCEGSWLPKKRRSSGIGHQRGESGTERTGATWLLRQLTNLACAPSAVLRSLARPDGVNAGFAPLNASLLLEEHLASTTKQGAVRSVELRSSATRTLASEHAVHLVERNYRDSHVRVYDMTVSVEHVFYANGILVGNCHDANQYMCMGFLREAQRDAQKRKSGFTIPRFANSYAF